MTAIFCIKRLIYGLITVHLTNYVVPQIYVYTFIPLFSIGYNLNNNPMNSRLLNLMENINEWIILCSGYFLLIFTQWICDPMERYNFGWYYIKLIIFVVTINLLLIFYEMGIGIKMSHRKMVYLRKWDAYNKNLILSNPAEI